MPGDIDDRDVLEWAGQQAALLRRVAHGERVNEVDRGHVVEAIEDRGSSELSAVRGHIWQLLLHLPKPYGWPGGPSTEHWRNELVVLQAEAARRFLPSMRQRVDAATLYQQARRSAVQLTNYGERPRPLPEACPFTLDELLNGDTLEILGRFQTEGTWTEADPGTGQP
jgi:hypothetical protein